MTTQFGFLLIVMSLLSGCTTGQKSAPGADGPAPKKVEILFSGRAGETTETLYHSNARTRKFADGQITNDRYESVDFVIETKTLSAKDGVINSIVKTVQKDGSSDLHDLAFPELNEQIEFSVRQTGQVLKAGKYPAQSIYFVPSLPVPGRLVEVGDTWTMEHTWYSGHEGIPLRLSVVGILKDIVPCEKNYCADIEVSGGVNLAIAPDVAGAKFDSKVWGRMLFSLTRGDVIWSEMRSREEMVVDSGRTLSESCMLSQMKGIGPAPAKFKCDPAEQAVTNIPKL